MVSREEIKAIKEMTREQKLDELFDSLSESVKRYADDLATMKAILKTQFDVAPEDFDIALNKELRKRWDEVKDLTREQLTLRVLGDLLKNGHGLEFLEEGED
jgi:tRNA U34 5-carboxymethylaminomethyl modifying GTPase MnmE/TrmE